MYGAVTGLALAFALVALRGRWPAARRLLLPLSRGVVGSRSQTPAAR